MYLNKFRLYIFSGFLAFFVLAGQPTNASISPSQDIADFGEVTLEGSSTIPIFITNRETDRTMSVRCMLQYGYYGFSVGTNSFTLDPGQTITVNAQFTPLSEGNVSDTLIFLSFSDDPQQPDRQIVQVGLTGSGVNVEQDNIENLLKFFDTSVREGSLKGSGPGASSENRISALRNMLVTSGSLIESGQMGEAYGQLKAALKRINCDKNSKARAGFVEGEAVVELAAMIQRIMETLIS